MRSAHATLFLLTLMGLGCPPPDEHDSDTDGPLVDSDTDPVTHTGETDTHTGHTGHTGETGDTAPPDPTDFWENLEWTGVSDLDVLTDFVYLRDSVPHWEVRICESGDGWGRGCEDYTTLAHSFSSLDGVLTENGLVLTGIPDSSTLEIKGFPIDRVHFFSTPDMENWGTHIYTLEGQKDGWVVDPAMAVMPDGQPSIIYYNQPMDCTEEPQNCPGDHDVLMASWDGTRFVVRDQPIHVDPDMVDPTMVPYLGQYHLFYTCDGDICHATSPDGTSFDYDDQFRWGGAQVPHANSYEDQLMVVGQGGGGWPPPRYTFMNADGSFPEQDEMLWSDHDNLSFFGGSCTSPVLVYTNKTYYTICAILVNNHGIDEP